MRCQNGCCQNEARWTQLTIYGDELEEHYCDACMATLGGTFRETPGHEQASETMKEKVS